MPVYMEATILDLPCIYINGGDRATWSASTHKMQCWLLKPVLVMVGIERGKGESPEINQS